MASSTWTTAKTWAVGDVLTAADMNTYVRDNTNAAFGSKAEGRYARSGISLANNTATATSWDSASTNTDGFGTPATSTITIPAGLGGRYLIAVHADIVTAGASRRYVEIIAGGNTWRTSFYGESGGVNSISTRLAAAATIVCNVYQNSGGALTLTSQMEFERTAA